MNRHIPAHRLTQDQIGVVESPIEQPLFLAGPAGTGKTTAAVERLLWIMEQGAGGSSILALTPQRSLAAPFWRAIEFPGAVAGGQPVILTPGGLARRMVELFWPVAASSAGFSQPDQPPTFLTMESAQYYMARIAAPLFVSGRFESLVLAPNRIYSQVLDNLNKSAFVGFPHTEIAARLISAGVKDRAQKRIYEDAQELAVLFRRFCLDNNLLDYSLQVEVFKDCLWPSGECRLWLEQTYRHLIFDNIEEDTPFTHDLLEGWLPHLDSALLIYDCDAGYRRFLGADPDRALTLQSLCSRVVTFTDSLVASPPVAALERALPSVFHRAAAPALALRSDYLPALVHAAQPFRFHNQMIEWAAQEAAALVKTQGVSPAEIVILAPYMPDSLRFSLVDRLLSLGIPVRSHRPSRPLADEPSARCLLTLAALAHPSWGFRPDRFDLISAFVYAIEEMDLVRAQLLAQIVYNPRSETWHGLTPFASLPAPMQARITPRLGDRYDRLRAWLDEYTAAPAEEIDIFFCRLFGEVLSQPGFRFHRSLPAGEIAANLVESAAAFRQAISATSQPTGASVGREFLQMVQEGVIAATYTRSWNAEPRDELLVAPAYTFLLANRPVDFQFWLDIPAKDWGERLDQPLTQPYVLSRWWPPGQKWTDDHEFNAGQDALYRLITGLVRRCRRSIYLGASLLSQQGYEQHGPLLRVVQRLLAE